MKWLNPDTMRFYTGVKKAQETMEADGYLPYYGTLPAERLAVTYEGDVAVIEELPEPPATEEWVPMSAFIGALYALLPAEKLAEIMETPELLKPAVAGMALLSSDLTQGGCIDLMNPKVSEYLAMVGLTMDQVKAAMDAAQR